MYICWLCYVPISIFLSFTPVLSINTNASRTLKFLRFCTQNTRETFKSASLYDPKLYKQGDPQSYFCASYMASKSLFYVFKFTSLCLLSTTIYTENWKYVLHFSKNSKKTESESIQSILVSRNISWDWIEREEEVIKGVKANLGTVLSRKKLFQINFFFWLLKAYYLHR